MGYRSEVGFAFRGRKEAIDALMERFKSGQIYDEPLEEQDQATREAHKWFLDEIEVIEDGEDAIMRFFAKGMKLYFEDEFVIESLEQAAEEAGCSGRFVRMGEDPDDVEIREFGDNPPSGEFEVLHILLDTRSDEELYIERIWVMDTLRREGVDIIAASDGNPFETLQGIARKAVAAAREAVLAEAKPLRERQRKAA
ncbi:hypothetical protein D6833_05040 [Candidatus Parcubacteria bacterium]|nr:MAG: hypothetical protein D6833_05040 [Candidatus Parcubacteria bacterium]